MIDVRFVGWVYKNATQHRHHQGATTCIYCERVKIKCNNNKEEPIYLIYFISFTSPYTHTHIRINSMSQYYYTRGKFCLVQKACTHKLYLLLFNYFIYILYTLYTYTHKFDSFLLKFIFFS